MLRRLQHVTLLLLGSANVTRQAEKCSLFVFQERRTLVDVMNKFMQPPERGVVADQKSASLIFQQATGEQTGSLFFAVDIT